MTDWFQVSSPDEAPATEPIAIIGLACRFPGAGDTRQFWRNLADGVESIKRWTLEEQEAVTAPEFADEVRDPNFVPVAALLDQAECLDAAFFGMSAREAEVRDPQQRLFLELAYTALEDAGYDPGRYGGDIGVYAGSGEDAYQWWHTRRNPAAYAAVGQIGVAIGSHPDYVATLASYKLNLRGPSLTVHTACSTALVAVHLACEALRNGECDMALGGGVNVDLPLGRGYLYVEEGVHSPDGHCRAFDAGANGTVWGSGGGVVLLKRLSDAIDDGDCVRAVVLGNAINNDGATKVGFTAPSQEGQAAVIAQALAAAKVDPRTISYVEAHGTGTALGDPIEVAALSSVFRQYSADVGWCGIGTVKTNIGHLGAAAGIAGLVKTVLALEHGYLPASLNFESPNPKIDFGSNPFYVNSAMSRWEAGGTPRRASVSSFGMGGTNAHMILEEAPPRPARRDTGQVHLLQLSARTPTALAAARIRLAEHLAGLAEVGEDGENTLGDVARTLRTGRAEFKERLAVTASGAGPAGLAAAAKALSDGKAITGTAVAPPAITLMFPGQGAQHAGMGAQLYQAERTFRDVIDECCGIAREHGIDLIDLILGEAADADERLKQTEAAQPALFCVEYALALQWRDWGVEPVAMIGHSVGEYVAATLAGVFTVRDALAVVVARGRLMQALPPGAMLAVQLAEAELRPLLPDGLSLAAVNGPGACVVSGPSAQISDFVATLDKLEVTGRRLRTSHAFHSAMMEPLLAEFRAVVAEVPRRPPQVPFLSNVTGDWITSADATDPSYWARHAREPVRFASCVAAAASPGDCLLLECGPGHQLSGLVRSQKLAGSVSVVASMPRGGPGHRESAPYRLGTAEVEAMYSAAGRLWVAGHKLDLTSPGGPGRRVPLPTYPWEREYFWIKPQADVSATAVKRRSPAGLDGWFAMPVWRQLPVASRLPVGGRCLLFAGSGAGSLGAALAAAGAEVIEVRPGAEFRRDDSGYCLRPGQRDDYEALIADLGAGAGVPPRIIHAWALDGTAASGGTRAGLDAARAAQNLGFFSLLSLVQAVAAAEPGDGCQLDVITAGTSSVTGAVSRPEHATVAGIVKVVRLELPWLVTRHVDIDPAMDLSGGEDSPDVTLLVGELFAATADESVLLSGGRRWERDFEPVTVPADGGQLPVGPGLRERGVYLITGGLGGIGITLAEDLARRVRARLVLVSRSGLPPRDQWDDVVGRPDRSGRAGRAVAAIRSMEQNGAEVLVLTADVTNADSMRDVARLAAERFGPIDGIVHAAGLPGDGMAEVKDRATAEAVLAPKVAGTLALREAFGDADLDFVVLCSSVTALAGGFGQVDYCAANSFLDAYATGADGWQAPVTSVNWGNWLEVGMAAEVVAPAAFRALQAGEITTAIAHPLITARHVGDDEVVGWCSGAMSAATHWLLDEHRLGQVPVLPGTGYLEAVRCAAEQVAPDHDGVLVIRDVVLTEPLRVPDGSFAELRVVFSRGSDGLDFEVVNVAGGVVRTHARGSLSWVREETPVTDVEAIIGRCSLAVHEDGAAASVGSEGGGSGLIAFGPRWSSLRRVHVGQAEELAVLEAGDAVAAELDRWPLHPALLDEALSFARMPGDQQYLPFGYGKVTVRGPLSGRLRSHFRLHDGGGTDEIVAADVSVFDAGGREIVSIADFTMRRVNTEAIGSQAVDAGPADVGAGRVAAVAANRALGSGGGQVPAGISPANGAEAFARLVGVNLGHQVVIAPQSIEEIVASVRGLTQETIESSVGSDLRSERSEAAAGDYVAPRNELERAIASAWAQVLGLDKVSVTDDFFELGGNSLIAVQVISMVRKETGLRLPMRSLFDDPTVAGAAAKIAELRDAGEQAEG